MPNIFKVCYTSYIELKHTEHEEELHETETRLFTTREKYAKHSITKFIRDNFVSTFRIIGEYNDLVETYNDQGKFKFKETSTYVMIKKWMHNTDTFRTNKRNMDFFNIFIRTVFVNDTFDDDFDEPTNEPDSLSETPQSA